MSETTKKGAEGSAPDPTIEAILREEISSLKAKVAALEQADADSKKELEDAAKMITELKAKLKDIKESGTEKVTVTIDKKTYTVNMSMRTKEKVLTPEDIAADKELCKKLIAKGSTILTEK